MLTQMNIFFLIIALQKLYDINLFASGRLASEDDKLSLFWIISVVCILNTCKGGSSSWFRSVRCTVDNELRTINCLFLFILIFFWKQPILCYMYDLLTSNLFFGFSLSQI